MICFLPCKDLRYGYVTILGRNKTRKYDFCNLAENIFFVTQNLVSEKIGYTTASAEQTKVRVVHRFLNPNANPHRPHSQWPEVIIPNRL